MISRYCLNCPTEIEIEDEWDFEDVTCSNCGQEHELKLEEYTEEDGSDSYYFFLEKKEA